MITLAKPLNFNHRYGIKLYLEDGGWVLLPSGTEPLMRVYMETNSLEKQTKVAQYMEKVISHLEPV